MPKINETPAQKMINKNEMALIVNGYQSGAARLLLLDYDGTLVQFDERPEKAVPDNDLFKMLASLAEKEESDVVIISGRRREFLERHFGELPLILIAEHGAGLKSGAGGWKPSATPDTRWKDEIRPLLELYCDRTPGAFIEEKDFSLAWDYRRSDVELASMRAMELKGNLLNMVANRNLGILEGNRVLEIKSLEVSKAKITSYLLSLKDYDFILGMGDDATDEDLFAAIPERGYSIKVGRGSSKARYHVADLASARSLLKKLVET